MARNWKNGSSKRSQSGFSLIELMISMIVLAIGMGGVLLVFTTAMLSNNRNRIDTEATFVSQSVLEQLASVPTTNATQFPIVDCANNTVNYQLSGPGATLDSKGNIDWTKSAVANYSANYVTCGNGTTQVTYQVRWAVSTWNGDRVFSVSSKASASSVSDALRFALPVTLRAINQTF
jgi:prepilin-type N-terminal cleavage/methylation domain-containing protein